MTNRRALRWRAISNRRASPSPWPRRRAIAARWIAAGFGDIEIRDRNAWYAGRAREELAALAGPLRRRLIELVGESEADRQTRVWETMLVVLDKGELRPTHLYGAKPAL